MIFVMITTKNVTEDTCKRRLRKKIPLLVKKQQRDYGWVETARTLV
jgi:hypothetical protein